MAEPELPVLWHLKVSHYNEKARWALDHKRVPHLRRAVLAGRQAGVAKKLTGGTTLPVLVIDGEAIGDSTRIIAALERDHPGPPLYPADGAERQRALELEDVFDEELGPHTRLLAMHHMLPDADLFLGAFMPDLRGAARIAVKVSFPALRRRITAYFGIDDTSVALAFDKVREAGERLRAERQPSGYLVGPTFTVADLTLAALLAPLVAPEQFPYPQPQRDDPRFAPVREALTEAGVLDWTRDIYRRHRGTSAEID
jgi:glutathione S-transferase